ncbi:hypothetical protein B0H10DRAFT_1266583 [Mycena sp. CBHHK59/15]|nr:hypothetical protein B0H10DRAFT_1266583 [Mycena sp. CBHHK59/15]
MLLLATLAYTARLAPAPAHRVAADLWYEQAAALLHAALASSSFASPSFPATSFTPSYTPGGGDSSGRSGGASGGLAAVQTLLLLALRDHGRGRDAHAWRGVGTAVRVAQELGLDRLDDVASFRPSSSSSTTATSTTALTSAAAAGTVEETKDEMGRETERQGQGQEQEEQEDREWRRGLWGTAGMLDLLLALQLGRAPGAAGADALRAGLVLDVVGSTNSSSSEVGEERGEDRHRREPSLLAHTHALARILARVHYYLYLGFGAHSTSSASAVASSSALASNATGGANNRGSNTNTSAQHAKLAALRRELDAWLRALPAAFRVVLGSSYPSSSFSPYTPHSSAHPSSAAGAGGGAEGDRCGSGGVDGESERERQERERSRERRVLEANMLYHVSVALLWRPFAKDPATPHAADVFLDAASTFNILLDRYRASGADALACANPNMIYLVFTAAIAHLAGFKLRQQQASAFPASAHRQTTRVLQTQLHLLNCLEALAGMGGTWELARRCARTLDRLMEAEGMRVGAPGAVDRPFGRPGSSAGGVRPPSSGGKRKRGYSVDAEEDARKRRDVERETDGEGDMSDASGSTSTLVGHLQTHHGHAQHLNHAQTPNQNPFLGWPQHDALESLDPGAWPIASTRWVADAEPAPALWDVDRLGFGFGGGCGGFGGGGTWESDWDEALWMRAGQGQGQLFGSGGAGGLAGMGGAAGGGGGGGVFGLGMWDASAPGG